MQRDITLMIVPSSDNQIRMIRGFDSSSGFVRAFLESTGSSPGQLRRGDVDRK